MKEKRMMGEKMMMEDEEMGEMMQKSDYRVRMKKMIMDRKKKKKN